MGRIELAGRPVDAAQPDSLVEQLRRMAGPQNQTDAYDRKLYDKTVCPDGYVRRSPVQPLDIPPGTRRRNLVRAIGIFAVIVLAAVIIMAVVSQGILF